MKQTIDAKTHFLKETRQKPPQWGVQVSLHMENNSPQPIWFVLPGYLDFPLGEVLEKVKKINLMKDESGCLYLKVYGHTQVTLFRLPPGESVSLPTWEFTVFDKIECTEIWAVENIKIGGRDLAAIIAEDGELAPPRQLPEGMAKLKSLAFSPRVKLEAFDKTGSFDIQVKELQV